MPSITIDEKGTAFFYLDSGKPSQEIYTTLFVLHGHSFNSNTFKKWIPLASTKGLRLICVNRRDYAPTTVYSPAELSELAKPEEFPTFLQARGVEIALLMDRLIDELSLPPPSVEGKSGGVALMGWSLGNVTSMAMFSSAASIPPVVHQRLQKYLRKFIVYSVPSIALGTSPPPNGYIPLFDDTIPLAERGTAFMEWVSCFYEHGDVSTRDPAVLNARIPVPGSRSTVSSMSHEELMSVIDTTPEAELLLLSNPNLLTEQMHKVVSDPETRALWPNAQVYCVHGDRETWNAFYGAWQIEKSAQARGAEVKFIVIPGMNHFGHWEEPARTLEYISNACH